MGHKSNLFYFFKVAEDDIPWLVLPRLKRPQEMDHEWDVASVFPSETFDRHIVERFSLTYHVLLILLECEIVPKFVEEIMKQEVFVDVDSDFLRQLTDEALPFRCFHCVIKILGPVMIEVGLYFTLPQFYATFLQGLGAHG